LRFREFRQLCDESVFCVIGHETDLVVRSKEKRSNEEFCVAKAQKVMYHCSPPSPDVLT
jgi:hypothetical protein